MLRYQVRTPISRYQRNTALQRNIYLKYIVLKYVVPKYIVLKYIVPIFSFVPNIQKLFSKACRTYLLVCTKYIETILQSKY